jgi:predicted DNA-binding protein (MmcQ/YjbR family)
MASPMTRDQFNAFCATLPHSSFVEQWGGAQVWKVGGPSKGKVFAIGWFDASVDQGITFKCSALSFELLKTQAGCRPAPYLASRGLTWIQRTSDETLSVDDLETYLTESHRLAALTLPKKTQASLGLG